MAAKCERERDDYNYLLSARPRYGSPHRSVCSHEVIHYEEPQVVPHQPSALQRSDPQAADSSYGAAICPYVARTGLAGVAVDIRTRSGLTTPESAA